MANMLSKGLQGLAQNACDPVRETELTRVFQQLEQTRCSLVDAVDNLIKRLEPVTANVPTPESVAKDCVGYNSALALRLNSEVKHLSSLTERVRTQLSQLEV